MNELHDLVDQLLAEVISPEDFAKLQELLRHSEASRKQYRELVRVHSVLDEAACMGWLGDTERINGTGSIHEPPSPLAAVVPAASRAPASETYFPTLASKWKWMCLGVAASSIFFLASVHFLRNMGEFGEYVLLASSNREVGNQGRVNSQARVNSARQASQALLRMPASVRRNWSEVAAILQGDVGAIWRGSEERWKVGDTISPGHLRLEGGVVELAFMNGATVIVEGPADLELVSGEHGILHHGRVRCIVPPGAEGFSIDTADAHYLDLGTEFGLAVGQDGKEELHVFEGKVRFSSRKATEDSQLVLAGNGLVSSGAVPGEKKNWESISSDPNRFADSEKLRKRKQDHDKSRLLKWGAGISKIRQHPDLVALYDFEPSSKNPHLLMNLAGAASHGAILGCRWSEGRWSGKRALEFKRVSDRVRIQVPGEHEKITMSAWVRIDGFDREFNSLMLTDLFDNGHVHWQVKSSGQLDAGIRPEISEYRQIVVSKQVLGYEHIGRWVHLALVIDQAEATVSHFVDGECVTRKQWVSDSRSSAEPTKTKIRFGAASLGNWNPKHPYDAWLVRNFNGRIDEFAIFSTAMSDFEVRELYETGRPDGKASTLVSRAASEGAGPVK